VAIEGGFKRMGEDCHQSALRIWCLDSVISDLFLWQNKYIHRNPILRIALFLCPLDICEHTIAETRCENDVTAAFT
jgi:hypothetical protein